MRRSLSHQGGPTRQAGDPATAELLADAMAAAERHPPDDLTHGFHTYPARMHPAIARTLVGELTQAGDDVLDPFCGSGTVLVEAQVAGRRARGVDLNPLALRVAEVHCAVVGPRARARFVAAAGAVAEASEARVRSRTKVRAPVSPAQRALYAPHVLLELGGLWREIRGVEHKLDRRALEVVLSSLVVKFSKQRSDTSRQLTEPRFRKGLVTEAFHSKAMELAERWHSLADAVPRRTPAVRLMEGDARDLPGLLDRRYRPRLLLTSPPYGGTYDYHSHHALRYPWLGLDAARMARDELGARRHLSNAGDDGARRWDSQVIDALHSAAGVVADDGLVVWLIGDGQVGRRRVDALEQVSGVCQNAGLCVVASASQDRPDARGGPPRREHLIALSAS